MYLMQYTDIDYIYGIKANDEKILHALYKQYFKMIRHYIITNHGNESDAKDIYHETLLILIHIVQRETFMLTSSLSTLIFAIAKRLWLKHLNKNKNIIFSDSLNHKNLDMPIDNEDEILQEYEEKEKNISKIQMAIQALGNPCYQLLKEFYYNKLNMEQIAQKLGYSNADVAKNQKYKCLQRLKRYFYENTSNNSFSIQPSLKSTSYES